MTFTALHRALGVGPCALTDDLLDQAVAAGVAETSDLDWKSALPPAKGLAGTDFPKDIAAMANSGGGLIVYGVREDQKAAVGRVDVGELDENYERSLHSAAVSAISPPVFGLTIHRLSRNGGARAVAVEVPASVDGPHLIYRHELFGAPIRNDADTVWMKERQIEAMYRERFNERRHSIQALDRLFVEGRAGLDVHERAWLIGVARPRLPHVGERPTRASAKQIFSNMEAAVLALSSSHGVHPLRYVDRLNPKPGLRRWVAASSAQPLSSPWMTASMSLHHDGSVTVSSVVGAHQRDSDAYFEGWEIEARAIEAAVADLLGLVRAAAQTTTPVEYDVRVGIEWTGVQNLTILGRDAKLGLAVASGSTPLPRYFPVETTIDASASDADYLRAVHGFVEDCVNQGGISDLELIRTPPDDS